VQFASLRVELRQHAGEEAAAGEHPSLYVLQVRITERLQACTSGRRGQPSVDDLVLEDLPRGGENLQLQGALRAEVGVQPTLADPHALGEAAEGQCGDALDRRQFERRLQDRGMGSLAVGAPRAGLLQGVGHRLTR
jgi:hypothetical protein